MKNTSWSPVADWYVEHLRGGDTYHAKVILPNLLRILKPSRSMRILDLACGEGMIAREIAKAGASVVGSDVSPNLIEKAREQGVGEYHVVPAERLSFAADKSFDVVTCILALQNMQLLAPVFEEVARVLKVGGRFVFVINHPVLRIPKRSSWGYDEKTGVQFRRLDGYYRASREKIIAHPGQKESASTWSFHRSLEEYFKALRGAGFVVFRLEEWLSHKTSEKGPRSIAEDRARKEFPLFMMAETLALKG